ncbi:MAG: short-chain dehydrogenase [Candidatus Rokuibacteriota bacterium]|nr:MAG: short-chain dehydrogenase [Candidatus Rokubacteria bacterium]
MDLGIRGKIALVTAASKGLGRGSAEALSAEGCRVAICARTRSDVERAATEIAAKTGHDVAPFTADMSKPSDIEALLRAVSERLGDPDIVVCNAGGPPPGTFASTKLDQFLPAVELSMMSSIRLTYAVVTAMVRKGWGRVVYITSVSVKQPIPYILLSNTARAGLTGFMKTVAREIAPTGVTVNAVLPGTHATDRVLSFEAVMEAQKTSNPMQTLGDSADFGAAVAFLCSRQARFITGENLLIDGGSYTGLV